MTSFPSQLKFSDFLRELSRSKEVKYAVTVIRIEIYQASVLGVKCSKYSVSYVFAKEIHMQDPCYIYYHIDPIAYANVR